MGILSFLLGDDEPVLRLALPAHDQAMALAWIRAPSIPDASELLELASRHVEGRAEDPFRVRLRRAIAEEGLSFEVLERRELRPPPLQAMRACSEEGWERRFEQATHAVACRAEADPAWPPVAAWLALAAAAGVAEGLGGLVMDAAIPRFIPRAGAEDRIPGDGRFLLSDHLVVSVSPERRDRAWLTTLGMARFSLPSIELPGVPAALAPRASWVVQAVALRLVEAAVAAPEDEDQDARLLEMDAEIALRPADVAAARGEDGDAFAFARPALVRLRPRRASGRVSFLTIGPAERSVKDADGWLASVVDAVVPLDDAEVRTP